MTSNELDREVSALSCPMLWFYFALLAFFVDKKSSPSSSVPPRFNGFYGFFGADEKSPAWAGLFLQLVAMRCSLIRAWPQPELL